MDDKQELILASGNLCILYRIRRDLIPNYYVLAFPKSQGQPSVSEVVEMMGIGTGHAQQLAKRQLDDAEAFTMIYSGYSARREKGWHIHIILLGNRWRKAWLYWILACKNLVQALGLRRDDSPRVK